jgi:cyclic beta-1,2-glucan synthetase
MAAPRNLSPDSMIFSSGHNVPNASSSAQTQATDPAEEPLPAPLAQALAHARNWVPAGHARKCPPLLRNFLCAKSAVEQFYRSPKSGSGTVTVSQEIRKGLLPFRIQLYKAVVAAEESLRAKTHVPQILESGEIVPRAYLIAKSYLNATHWEFDEDSFLKYAQSLQATQPLEIEEIWLLSPMLQLCLLLQLVGEIKQATSKATPELRERLGKHCENLTRVRQLDWVTAFSTLSVTESILATDPAGIYEEMESQSRYAYRKAIQELARYSSTPENEIARIAITLAQEAVNSPELQLHDSIRFTHVGFYLIDSGRKLLEDRIGYHPNGFGLLRKTLLEGAELYYFLGVELAIFVIMIFLLSAIPGAIPPIATSLLLLLPCSQAALEIANQFVRALLSPRIIPRLDFQKGIPEENSTVVAVPALLTSKPQVEHLVRALEIRYLGNTDSNLYFALLTDLPDSVTASDEKDELAACCSGLIDNLNRKYALNGPDHFFHLHRNRTFNERENTWMGWERKRGKLLDLNELILGREDKFPIKAGNVSLLRKMKYVITLDADTQLPRGVAASLVGAMAHPLNRAVVDPLTRTVTAGYGVMQPRIGISVQSVNRSRLAYIYSGETGLDIYTHAVSDVYQDLFGEAIFSGKGIYDVRVFHEVLWDRFPSNAILSHDLIEGVYTRTGLISDVELIDDYPSHFSAYSRRKHRWVRGDWQILKWLFPRVPNAKGQRVPNPLQLLSRWKILDNLRRSVIEAATFALLLACWFYLPGSPGLWTVATVAMLLIPSYVHASLTAVRQYGVAHSRGAVFQVISDFATSQVNVLVFLAFLPHQALVTLDAIARTLVRLTLTHQKLLEWETAAQSEMDQRRDAPADRYLKFIPILTLSIGVALAIFRPASLPSAIPILLLWLVASPAVKWLDRPLKVSGQLTVSDQGFLRQLALKTWRFFRQYSTSEENWFIPDNIQGKENQVAHRLSTTNLGLLFNVQLAAALSGMQSVPQFAAHASRTMASVKRLPRVHGHLLNWYDSRTLEPLDPQFISSVDNGNLVCCLWTLKQGVSFLSEQPLFSSALFQSTLAMLDTLLDAMRQEGCSAEAIETVKVLRVQAGTLQSDVKSWCVLAPKFLQQLASIKSVCGSSESDVSWWLEETSVQLHSILELTRDFAPWLLPKFAVAQEELPQLKKRKGFTQPALYSLQKIYSEILHTTGSSTLSRLQTAVTESVRRLDELLNMLQELAADTERLVDEMDFGLFYDKGSRAISVGYSVPESKLIKACYDLLASEARAALFIGIAKNDVPQEAWFQLSRLHTHYASKDVLVSWTGTMFEYLMPAVWFKHFPNTLMENSLQGAIDCQRAFSASYGIPWGMSEGACPPKVVGTPYDYQAFGLPQLALSAEASKRIVITPYAGALALNVDSGPALLNLRDMSDRGWVGSFGLYESVEYFRASEARTAGSFEIVRAWMAHHQGMILLSICNALGNSIFPQLFHQDVRVETTERLLHELPLTPIAREISRTGLELGVDTDNGFA